MIRVLGKYDEIYDAVPRDKLSRLVCYCLERRRSVSCLGIHPLKEKKNRSENIPPVTSDSAGLIIFKFGGVDESKVRISHRFLLCFR